METVNVSMDKLGPDDEPSKTFDWILEEEFNAGSIELTGVCPNNKSLNCCVWSIFGCIKLARYKESML